jgi:hypothetical protein
MCCPSTLEPPDPYSRHTTISYSVRFFPSVTDNLLVLMHTLSHFTVQQWTDVKVVDLEAVSRAAITGKKPNTVGPPISVLQSHEV